MKSFTRTLPLRFQGELHDVELVQFSLDPDEARRHLPEPFTPRLVNGRALVSLVNVRLVGMRPRWIPRLLTFGFRHIALRMMIDDRPFTGMDEELVLVRADNVLGRSREAGTRTFVGASAADFFRAALSH